MIIIFPIITEFKKSKGKQIDVAPLEGLQMTNLSSPSGSVPFPRLDLKATSLSTVDQQGECIVSSCGKEPYTYTSFIM